MTRKPELLRRNLAGPAPTPVEVALAERAALDWLVLNDAELRLAAVLPAGGKRAEFWGRRVDGHGVVVVEDDGAGFDPDGVPKGRLGLAGMRERLATAGGTLEPPLTSSAAGSGNGRSHPSTSSTQTRARRSAGS